MHKTRAGKTILIERIIIAWAILATAAYCVQKATVNYSFDYDFLSHPAYEHRFEGLSQTLSKIGKAFYVTDPMPNQYSELALNRKLLANYCLAPYLSSDIDSQYLVTDFHHPIDLQQWAQDHQLELIRDYQDGVALFKKIEFH